MVVYVLYVVIQYDTIQQTRIEDELLQAEQEKETREKEGFLSYCHDSIRDATKWIYKVGLCEVDGKMKRKKQYMIAISDKEIYNLFRKQRKIACIKYSLFNTTEFIDSLLYNWEVTEFILDFVDKKIISDKDTLKFIIDLLKDEIHLDEIKGLE